MTWRRVALLPTLIALWACAEGGIRGSGISTSVLGNVASVQPTAAAAPARSTPDLGGIAVTIEGTAIAGETAADGTFSLQGAFEGFVTLVFELPDNGGQARIDLNVPADGTLTLHDVHVDAHAGVAVADTAEVDFDGAVTAVDCDAGLLTMKSWVSTPGDVDQYLVELDTSSLQDSHGAAVPCSAVRINQRGWVQGTVNRDGSFGNATIVLQN